MTVTPTNYNWASNWPSIRDDVTGFYGRGTVAFCIKVPCVRGYSFFMPEYRSGQAILRYWTMDQSVSTAEIYSST
jgi:hypothetical protein